MTQNLQTTGQATGTVIIISAPSGTGKTSLVQQLVQRLDRIEVSVSHTTRAPRAGEIDGTHYHFVDHAQFEALVEADDMLEYAKVFDNMYGTSGSFVAERLAAGLDVILEIDWQGAAIARQKLTRVVSIMILPPSQEALAERLRGRGKDAPEVIARRLDLTYEYRFTGMGDLATFMAAAESPTRS